MVRQKPEDQEAQALGHAIRVIRTERGLNRKELAERSGISYPYLSEIEAGKKRPSTKTLSALGEALGVRPAEFLAAADSLAQGPRLWSSPSEHMSGPIPASPGSFFSFDEDPDLDMKADQVFQPAPLRSEVPIEDRDELLETLLLSAQELTQQDLERLIDLARRLGTSR